MSQPKNTGLSFIFKPVTITFYLDQMRMVHQSIQHGSSERTVALAEISTLEDYCEWMKNLFTPIPDGRYELKFMAADEANKSVAAFAIFHGTQTGPGGPVPPTGNTIAADYVYHMIFDGESVTHLTKIWNDSISMQQLGWD